MLWSNLWSSQKNCLFYSFVFSIDCLQTQLPPTLIVSFRTVKPDSRLLSAVKSKLSRVQTSKELNASDKSTTFSNTFTSSANQPLTCLAELASYQPHVQHHKAWAPTEWRKYEWSQTEFSIPVYKPGSLQNLVLGACIFCPLFYSRLGQTSLIKHHYILYKASLIEYTEMQNTKSLTLLPY